MSGTEVNYGKKGSCFGKFILFFALFIILLIWVYYKNFNLTFDFILPFLG